MKSRLRRGEAGRTHFDVHYADILGVSGGLDIPYKRFSSLHLHDKGGSVTFDANLGHRPRRVRNSLVMYATEMEGDKPLRDG